MKASLFTFPRPSRSTDDTYNAGNSPTVAKESQLRREMGKMRRRYNRTAGLFTGEIVVTEGFTLRAPFVNDIPGLGIRGTGRPVINVAFTASQDYVIRMSGAYQALEGLLFTGDEAAIIAGTLANPTSFLQLGAANYAFIARVWTAMGSTYSILSTEAANRVWIQDSQLEKDMSLNIDRGWIRDCSTGDITLQSGSNRVSITGTNCGDVTDNSGNTNNTATGNTGGGTITTTGTAGNV